MRLLYNSSEAYSSFIRGARGGKDYGDGQVGVEMRRLCISALVCGTR